MSTCGETSIVQFENANALRNYPFAASSSLIDDFGRPLPPNAIVDLHMVVPADIDASTPSEFPKVKMTSLHISPSMVSVCFMSDGGAGKNALSVTVSADGFRPYYPYRMEKLYGSHDIGGVVSFGEMEFPGYPETYRFNPRGIEGSAHNPDGDAALVHQCCVAVAQPARLREFLDKKSGERISGDVRIDFSSYVVASRDGRSISLSLSEGATSQLRAKCSGLPEGPDMCGATPIRSINGIRPDDDGNIVLWFH